MRMLKIGMLLAYVLLAPMAAAQSADGKNERRDVDTSQADLMLSLLERAAKGESAPELVERVMQSPGTALIIQQMNIMRRVTPEQYRALLAELGSAEPPGIVPVDESERARRGVEGLTQNVWPVLRWGLAHTDLLRERLEEAKALQVYERSRRRALDNLPGRRDVAVETHIVLGGRAGAAALAGGQIYVDLLLLSYQAGQGRRVYSAEDDLVRFFAHEMHHVGYSQLRQAHRLSLRLDSSEEFAYHLLSSLLSEGSATYLVDYGRDVDRMRGEQRWSDLSERGKRLLADCEAVLHSLWGGEIKGQDDYDRATPFLLGSGAHAAGSLMLSIIDEQGGMDAVMNVMLDPRTLLVEYNKAAATSPSKAGLHLFDAGLAAELSRMGDETRGTDRSSATWASCPSASVPGTAFLPF